jgi:5-methyltetrahydropteroyltriglutamate--homocysteine methyltransferase
MQQNHQETHRDPSRAIISHHHRRQPAQARLAGRNRKLWPQWQAEGTSCCRPSRRHAAVDQAAGGRGLDIVGDGEQSRQHFVHGFLEQVEGIDFEHKVKMGIRNNRYDAMVPQVVAPLRLKGRVHAVEAQLARAHTKKKLKFTLPGPMTIVDTVADRFYGDKVKMAFAFAELLNQEALALQADGVDIIQFDEPAFNVYMKEAADWGVQALERAAQGLTCTTRSTSATATASRPMWTGSRRWATSGVSTSRSSRRWPKAASSR